MRAVIVYFAVAVATLPVFALLLRRSSRTETIWRRLVEAVVLAPAWPVMLPLVSFAVTRATRAGAEDKRPGARAALALVSSAPARV